MQPDRIAAASAYGTQLRPSLLAQLHQIEHRAIAAADVLLANEAHDTARSIRRAYDNHVQDWAPLVGLLVAREPKSLADVRAAYAATLTDPTTGVCPAAWDHAYINGKAA